MKSEIDTKQLLEAQYYFIHLVFQEEYIPRWEFHETQIQTLCAFWNVTMGGEVLVVL